MTCKASKVIPAACFVLLLALGLGCGAEAWAAAEKLKVVTGPFLANAPLFIALEEDYFKQEDLEVEIVIMRRTATGLPMLIQGEYDILLGTNTFSVFNSMAMGAKLKIVAARSYFNPAGCSQTGLLSRTDLGLSKDSLTREKLLQLRLAANPKSSRAFMAERFLNRYGLTLKDAKIVDIPATMLAQALKNRAVDLVLAAEPHLSRIVKAGQGRLLLGAHEILPDYDISTVFFGPSLLEGKPDPGVRFIRAYLRGVKDYLKGKTRRNIEILSKHTKMKPALLKRNLLEQRAARWTYKQAWNHGFSGLGFQDGPPGPHRSAGAILGAGVR